MTRRITTVMVATIFFILAFLPGLDVSASSDEYIFELIDVKGTVTEDVVFFNYTGYLKAEHDVNTTIRLLGPPQNLGINSVRFDDEDVQIYFSDSWYYIPVHLTEGDHIIEMEFESSLSKYGQRSLSYRLFGPVLKYLFNIDIPKQVGTDIDVKASDGANVEDLGETVEVSWRLYAIRDHEIDVVWDSPVKMSGVDLRTRASANATVTTGDLVLEVDYVLEFPDRVMDELPFTVDHWIEVKGVPQDLIWDGTRSVLVPVTPIKDKAVFTLEFVIQGPKHTITVPHPSIGTFHGTLIIVQNRGIEAQVVEVFDASVIDPTYVRIPPGGELLGAYTVTEGSRIVVERTATLIERTGSMFVWTFVDTKEIRMTEVLDLEVMYQRIDTISLTVPADMEIMAVLGVDDWKVKDGDLVLTFEGGMLGSRWIEIKAKAPMKNRTISPIVPSGGFDIEVHFAVASSASAKTTVTPKKVDAIELDEIPTEFQHYVDVPEVVQAFKGDHGSSLELEIHLRDTMETRTTVIEFAQYTLIRTRDGKLMARVSYMTKNTNQEELMVNMPEGAKIWYLLVAGKVTEVIEDEGRLMIPLIRSMVSGRSIPYSIEIMYVIPDRAEDLNFLLPSVDIPIVSIEVNIGVPRDMVIDNPQKDNPEFDFIGSYKWNMNFPSMYSGSGGAAAPMMTKDYGVGLQTGIFDIANDQAPASMLSTHKETYGNLMLRGQTNDEELAPEDLEIYRGNAGSNSVDALKFKVDTSTMSQTETGYSMDLAPGQYVLEYGNSTRYVQVLPGMDQQVVLSTTEGWSDIQMPPISIDIPSTGKLLKFRRIFISSMEPLDIQLTKGEPKEEMPDGLTILGLCILIATVAGIGVSLRKRSRERPKGKVNRVPRSKGSKSSKRTGRAKRKVKETEENKAVDDDDEVEP